VDDAVFSASWREQSRRISLSGGSSNETDAMIASLSVLSGPMFAGKITSLIATVNAAVDVEGASVVIVKPAMDNRYADNAIVTHDGVAHLAVPVTGPDDVFGAVAAAAGDGRRPLHVFADEVQFMERPHFDGDFHLVVHTLLMAGHRVTGGGLDCDWRGMPFDVTSRLLAMADHVTKLTARCAVSGQPAQKTYKKVADGTRVALGAADTYEPRSNAAWEGAERRDDHEGRAIAAAVGT
jgi:thymidine kinase